MPTLLVVDDDEQIREFLRKSLPQDLTVVEAADGAQAVAAAKWSHPQVVIMEPRDARPRRVRGSPADQGRPATKGAVLVAVTGALIENAVPKARAAGFSYFVHKEVGARSFVEKIVKLVREAAVQAPAAPEAPAPTPPPSLAPAPPSPSAEAPVSVSAAGPVAEAAANASSAPASEKDEKERRRAQAEEEAGSRRSSSRGRRRPQRRKQSQGGLSRHPARGRTAASANYRATFALAVGAWGGTGWAR
jgi:CheY-like chemotaxis protein